MSGKGKGGRGKVGGGKSQSRSAKAGLQFPVGRINRFLKNARVAKRIGAGAPVYLAAIMEYLAAEILEDCREVDRGAGADPGAVAAGPEVPVDPTDRELEPGARRARLGPRLGLATLSTTSRHDEIDCAPKRATAPPDRGTFRRAPSRR